MDLLCLTIIGTRLQERSSVKQHTLDEPVASRRTAVFDWARSRKHNPGLSVLFAFAVTFTASEALRYELSDAVSLHVGDRLCFSDVIDWARSLCRVAMTETSNGSSVRYEEFSGMMTIHLFTKQSTAL